ncbi:MAG: cadherin-like domain-containing protein [Deltaproteobacteria bacterium]|nr:cadherin-like domain-containing protein [Deltaproteobacteria bacterium]
MALEASRAAPVVGESVRARLTWTIVATPGNDSPNVRDATYSVDEGSSLSVPVAAGLATHTTDPELDPFSFRVLVGPTHGAVTVGPSGDFTYAPADPEFNGADSFTVLAEDSHGASSASATVRITVVPVNDLCSLASFSLEVDEDSPRSCDRSRHGPTPLEHEPSRSLGRAVVRLCRNRDLAAIPAIHSDVDLANELVQPIVRVALSQLDAATRPTFERRAAVTLRPRSEASEVDAEGSRARRMKENATSSAAMKWLLPSCLGLLLCSGLALAQPQTSTAAKPRAIPEGFEPISGKEKRAENVNASTMVVGAYSAVLLLVFGFVIHIVRSQAEVAREMKGLAERIEKGKRS